MAYGFQCINSSDIIQIDANYKCHRLVAQGIMAQGTYVSGSYVNPSKLVLNSAWIDAVVFVRPTQFNKAIGFVEIYLDPTNGNALTLSILGYTSIEYRVYSQFGTPISASGTHGIQVFDSSGATVFDSNLTYPKITSSYHLPQSSGLYTTSGGVCAYPKTVNFSGNSQIPWVCAEPLMPALNYASNGNGDEPLPAICVSWASNNSCIVDIYGVAYDWAVYNESNGNRSPYGDPYNTNWMLDSPHLMFMKE